MKMQAVHIPCLKSPLSVQAVTFSIKKIIIKLIVLLLHTLFHLMTLISILAYYFQQNFNFTLHLFAWEWLEFGITFLSVI